MDNSGKNIENDSRTKSINKIFNNSRYLRGIGKFFMIISLVGIIISLLGVVFIWMIRPKIQSGTLNTLEIINETLHTTNKSLVLMGDVLDLAAKDIIIVESTINDLDITIESISDSLDTTAELVGEDLRQTIFDTQTTLSAASSSAEIIDNTLFFLAQVPFIGVDYDPDVPLHTSLLRVSDNLEDIPTSLETMEQTIKDASNGLVTLNTNMASLSDDITNFKMELVDAKLLLEDYKDIIELAEERMAKLYENVRLYTIITATTLTFILLWSVIICLSVYMQGMQLLSFEKELTNPEDQHRNAVDDQIINQT